MRGEQASRGGFRLGGLGCTGGRRRFLEGPTDRPHRRAPSACARSRMCTSQTLLQRGLHGHIPNRVPPSHRARLPASESAYCAVITILLTPYYNNTLIRLFPPSEFRCNATNNNNKKKTPKRMTASPLRHRNLYGITSGRAVNLLKLCMSITSRLTCQQDCPDKN